MGKHKLYAFSYSLNAIFVVFVVVTEIELIY